MAFKQWLMGAFALVLGQAVAAPAPAPAQDLRIQFAEKVAIPAAAGHTEFDAYGRRFALTLETNSRLLAALPAAQKIGVVPAQLLKGKVDGVAGSWVRLARVGGALEGAIWDGHDLYVVTSKARIEANLTLAVDGAPSQTVVYRLSDTIGGLPAQFCGLSPALEASSAIGRTALDQYKSMVAELSVTAAASATEQLNIALIGDTSFQNMMGAAARDSMLARLNTVDGIFGEQVGVLIVATEIRLVPGSADPFTSTNPETLLGQLADYRFNNAAVKAPGLAHLITGKNLDGDTIGIGYLDALCEPRFGASLSDSELGEFYSALVMAHELGHNFGAPHDGVAGACLSTPQNYLMAPALNGSSQFSACSLTQIQRSVAAARNVCIGTLNYADAALEFPTTQLTFNVAEEFAFPITVRSSGNEIVRNVSVRIDLPQQVTYRSAVVTGGSCNVAGSSITCLLGDLAAGQTRPVELRLISNTLGTYQVYGVLSADNDVVPGNNSQVTTIGLQSAVDLGVAMSLTPTQLYATDPVDITIDVSSTRSQVAHGGVLNLNASGAPIESFSAGPHGCQIVNGQPYLLACNLADIAAHDTSRITVRVRPTSATNYYVQASVSIQNDGDYTNNYANASFSVRPETEVTTTASSENLRVVVGTPADVVYTLRAGGRLPASNVQIMISDGSESIQSIVPSSGTCTRPGPGYAYTCDFGTLNPGDTRTVTVSARLDAVGQTAVVATTQYTNGTTPGYSTVFTWIYANVRYDAQAGLGGGYGIIEGRTGTLYLYLDSTGADPAQNVVATLDLPAPIRVTNLRVDFNPHGLQCVIVTAQRVRCSGSFGPNSVGTWAVRASVDYTSDIAAAGPATFVVTADGDAIPSNDSSLVNLVVGPAIEVNLTSATQDLTMTVGRVAEMNLTFSTGHNAVQNAYVTASGSNPYYAVESISFNNADCPRAPGDTSTFGGWICAVGDLPANGSWPVVVRYRAYQAGVFGGIFISGGAQNQTGGNGGYVFSFSTTLDADLQVAVAQISATTTSGAKLRYPRITVSSTGSTALNVDVDIELPAFTTLSSVTANAICTGTSTLHCHFYGIGANAAETIDIQLNTSATGTFTSNIAARAGNDFTSANNAASVALSVTAASNGGGNGGGSGSSSSGGGGGGRLEWLGLLFLGLLVARRIGKGGASRPLPAIH